MSRRPPPTRTAFGGAMPPELPPRPGYTTRRGRARAPSGGFTQASPHEYEGMEVAPSESEFAEEDISAPLVPEGGITAQGRRRRRSRRKSGPSFKKSEYQYLTPSPALGNTRAGIGISPDELPAGALPPVEPFWAPGAKLQNMGNPVSASAFGANAERGFKKGAYKGNRSTALASYRPLIDLPEKRVLTLMAPEASPADIANFIAATQNWNTTHLEHFMNLPQVQNELEFPINRSGTRGAPPDSPHKIGFVEGRNGKIYPTTWLAIISAAGGNLGNVVDLANAENQHQLGLAPVSAQERNEILQEVHAHLSRPGQTDPVGLNAAIKYMANFPACQGIPNLRERLAEIADLASYLDGEQLQAVISSLGYQGVLPAVYNLRRKARYAGGSPAPYSVGSDNTQLRRLVERSLVELGYPNVGQNNPHSALMRDYSRLMTTYVYALTSNCHNLEDIENALAHAVDAREEAYEEQIEKRQERLGPRAPAGLPVSQVPMGTKKVPTRVGPRGGQPFYGAA